MIQCSFIVESDDTGMTAIKIANKVINSPGFTLKGMTFDSFFIDIDACAFPYQYSPDSVIGECQIKASIFESLEGSEINKSKLLKMPVLVSKNVKKA